VGHLVVRAVNECRATTDGGVRTHIIAFVGDLFHAACDRPNVQYCVYCSVCTVHLLPAARWGCGDRHAYAQLQKGAIYGIHILVRYVLYMHTVSYRSSCAQRRRARYTHGNAVCRILVCYHTSKYLHYKTPYSACIYSHIA
jgi:hypothetical protein